MDPVSGSKPTQRYQRSQGARLPPRSIPASCSSQWFASSSHPRHQVSQCTGLTSPHTRTLQASAHYIATQPTIRTSDAQVLGHCLGVHLQTCRHGVQFGIAINRIACEQLPDPHPQHVQAGRRTMCRAHKYVVGAQSQTGSELDSILLGTGA